MAVEQGMNRPVVLEVTGQLNQDHNTLMDIQNQANQAVTQLGSNWFGGDADQYQSEWSNQSKVIQAAADSIQAMSKLATDQASQQADTSQA